MKKIIFSLLPCLIMIFFTNITLASDTYKIGGLWDITGPVSYMGEREYLGGKMAVDLINKRGGINGNPIELVYYDTKGKEAEALLSARKLVQKDNVLAIWGPTCSGPSMAVIPFVEKAKVPIFVGGTSVPCTVPVDERKYIFRGGPTARDSVFVMLDYLKKKNLDKIALLTITNAYGQDQRNDVKKFSKDFGIEIITEETYGQEDTDMTVQLSKIKECNPKAIVQSGVGPAAAIVYKNHQQLDIKAPLVSGVGQASPSFRKLAGGAAVGQPIVTPRIDVAKKLAESDPQKGVILEFKKEYVKRYDKEPGIFGARCYDSFIILESVLKKSGPSREKIRDEIEKVRDFVGAYAIYNYTSTNHDGASRHAMIMSIAKPGGEWEPMTWLK